MDSPRTATVDDLVGGDTRLPVDNLLMTRHVHRTRQTLYIPQATSALLRKSIRNSRTLRTTDGIRIHSNPAILQSDGKSSPKFVHNSLQPPRLFVLATIRESHSGYTKRNPFTKRLSQLTGRAPSNESIVAKPHQKVSNSQHLQKGGAGREKVRPHNEDCSFQPRHLNSSTQLTHSRPFF